MGIERETITINQHPDGITLEVDRTKTNSEWNIFSSVEEGVKKIRNEQLKHRVAMSLLGALGVATAIFGIRELITGVDGIIHGIKADSEHVYPGLAYLWIANLNLSMSKDNFRKQGLDKRKLSKLGEINKVKKIVQ